MKNTIFAFATMLLLSGTFCLAADTSAEKLIAFRTMEKGHKADWFKHMQKLHDDKYNLLIESHNEWFDYGNENTREWENADCSAAGKDKVFTSELDRAVALHKKQVHHWKELFAQHHKEAHDIQARHEKELEEFLAPAKEETVGEKTEGLVEELKHIGEEIKEKIAEEEAAAFGA